MEGSRFLRRKDFYKKHLPQQKATQKALAIIDQISTESEVSREVDFFFYTNSLEKAKKLSTLLQDLGYEVYEPQNSGEKISVSGSTCPIPIDEKPFLEWVEKMNDLGYTCDCDFDGWGMGSELDEPFDPNNIF